MAPFFSVIVPVFQAEKTLDRCVRSVLEQSFQDFELILIDDGSTDDSGRLCDAYAAEDARIRVLHQSNSGVSRARNAGICLAAGTYLLFLDSDDALFPDALSGYANAAENGSMDVVIGALSVLEDGKEIRRIGSDRDFWEDHRIWDRICRNSEPFGYAGGKLIRRTLVREHSVFFDADMRSQEDLDFFLSAYSVCEKFCVSSRCGYAYHYAPSGRTPPTWDFIANQLKLLRLARERTQLSPEAENCVQKRILSLVYTSLYTAAEQGTFAEMLQRMEAVVGLKAFLAEISAKGEHGFVAKAFASGKYTRIEGYFAIRHRLRDLYRILRRKH